MPVLSNPLLSPHRAAELLNVSAGTLAVWRCTRRYPELAFVKVGRAVKYREEDVLRFIERRTVGGDSE